MFISATRLAGLDPGDRAAFATNARLLSCLVTESLRRALYIPISRVDTTGICVILQSDVSSPPRPTYGSEDILAIVPLLNAPLFRHDGADFRAKEISLVDPLDMLPIVLEVADVTETIPAEIEVLIIHFGPSLIPDRVI